MKNKSKNKSKYNKESKVCVVVMALLALLCILPMVMVVSGSVTDEQYLNQHGFSILPHEFTLSTYKFLLRNKGMLILRAYGMSLAAVVLGTVYAVTMDVCFAYAVTQKKSVFRFSRVLSFFGWFSGVFSGGVLPWYILCTQYYGLKNNIWALVIPNGLAIFNVFMLRGSFREIPQELFESAQLDGATHRQIFTKVAIPLARGGIVTVALFRILGLWNDFGTPLYLLTDSSLNTMTKLLYSMLNNMAILLKESSMQSVMEHITLPTYSAKMVVVVLTIAPVIAMYPFALKYFVRGINMGGVKG